MPTLGKNRGGWSGASVGVGMLRGRGIPSVDNKKIFVPWFLGSWVSWFLGVLAYFLVSTFFAFSFLGFLVSVFTKNPFHVFEDIDPISNKS